VNPTNRNRAGKPGTHIHILYLLVTERMTGSCSKRVATCYGISVKDIALIFSDCMW